jgi:hypothetical protein
MNLPATANRVLAKVDIFDFVIQGYHQMKTWLEPGWITTKSEAPRLLPLVYNGKQRPPRERSERPGKSLESCRPSRSSQ